MSLIQLNDVHVSYGGEEVLRGVTCAVEGGAVGLLGPNGAGKSTMLKTLLGFLRARAGTVELFGKRMPEHALDIRQRLGYMPERDVVSPKISAVSFLTYCGSLFGMTRVDAMERAHEVLNYVGIGESRYRKMETYSTGMLQRVKFAQALIHDPKLLLLDEPTTGLDPEGRLEMLELIQELAGKRKVTVLLSTHLLPDVEQVCDKVIMINKGRIVLESAIDDLTAARDGWFEVGVRDNQQSFTEALTQAGFNCQMQQNSVIVVSMSTLSTPSTSSTTPSAQPQRVIFDIARSAQTQIRHFRPVRQSLEAIFVEAMAREP